MKYADMLWLFENVATSKKQKRAESKCSMRERGLLEMDVIKGMTIFDWKEINVVPEAHVEPEPSIKH
jgi:hypothetical protein